MARRGEHERDRWPVEQRADRGSLCRGWASADVASGGAPARKRRMGEEARAVEARRRGGRNREVVRERRKVAIEIINQKSEKDIGR